MDRATVLEVWTEMLQRQIWSGSEVELRAAEEGFLAQAPSAGVSLPDVLRELSDESLALAIQKGFLVRESFTELFVTRYGAYLTRWLFRWGTKHHEVLDLIQQVYIRFYERRLHLYRPTESFRAYLRQSAYNLWVQKVVRPKRCDSLAGHGEVASVEPSPEQALLDQETIARIDHAVEQLGTQERNVVKETMAGSSADEIAQALGLRKEQVFMYLFRGRRRLERLLQLPSQKRPFPPASRQPGASKTPNNNPGQGDHPQDGPPGFTIRS